MVATVTRHLVAAVAALSVFLAEGFLNYLGLLSLALVTGADAGGPLAGPVMVLMAVLLGLVLVPTAVTPAVAIAEAVAARLRPAARIAIASAVASALGAMYATAAGMVGGAVGTTPALLALALPLPAVGYAVVVHGTRAVGRLHADAPGPAGQTPTSAAGRVRSRC
ncbi:hypothetical protein GA0070616_0676 [Micromonospora nigra]|uniref:Uncharacterized protein n=1 Tax=Micromonospora nigra TaxID=145857 RepID=A0A1C6RDP3_9ACTN|nr:hypothetical protein [Micromonospora nigra]SCL15260.1 hypothetical protein GA0070616_0676 [Micromonospora nigra]